MRLTVCRDSYKNGLRAEDDDIGSNPILCAFDGVEIGSTGVKKETRSQCASDCNRKKTITANDNFAPSAQALAA
jgi:hypothetical protein